MDGKINLNKRFYNSEFIRKNKNLYLIRRSVIYEN